MSSSSSQYIDRKTVNASYRPKAGAMSIGLQRARAPYRVRNAVTGLALGAFAFGVWAYSISAVKQDVFDDVDEEARAMAQTGTMSEASKAEETVQAAAVVRPIQVDPVAAKSTNIPLPTFTQHRGLLQHLDNRFPRMLDPKNKTLVWGAPPVDNIGKIGGS
ncbi:hypothetical protein J132_10399 [Termitomyces sp. J132]|nr:hypothetical protein H2248_006789 [Termitomyces sp. 'cryptogamus']KNZ76424.1 hypothetical protein J132_10399 [Termitomyces sp. J132]